MPARVTVRIIHTRRERLPSTGEKTDTSNNNQTHKETER